MPEFPDIVVYIEALEQRILKQTLERATISSPFLLRSATPPISNIEGKKIVELRRLGKRICFGLEDQFWLVLHLMIAGRLHWNDAVTLNAKRGTSPTVREGSASRTPKNRLATFQFSSGTLSLAEAGSQRRASLHVVQGEDNLKQFNAGGLEIFEIDLDDFSERLRSTNHTLKRALTDPRLFSGIGNAYSDEILWHAQLSPVALTQKLKAEDIARLFRSTQATLNHWLNLLRAEVGLRGSSPTVGEGSETRTALSKVHRPKSKVQGDESPGKEGELAPAPNPIGKFPEKVTAFRPELAVHGKYQQPCPRCGAKVQRIRYASNETNYCPVCQTGGKLLADRALSRLLRSDWPRTADELEGLVRTQ